MPNKNTEVVEVSQGSVLCVRGIVLGPNGEKLDTVYRRLAQANVVINRSDLGDVNAPVIVDLDLEVDPESNRHQSLVIQTTSASVEYGKDVILRTRMRNYDNPQLGIELALATPDEVTDFERRGGRFSYQKR